MKYLLPVLLEIALTTYCVVDVARHRDAAPHGLHKVFWILILLIFPYVPEAAWLYLQWRSRGTSDRRLRTPTAPDDDPEFLRWLGEQQRRRQEEN